MNIHKAIKAINSSAEFTCQDENIDTIQWLNDTTPIAKSDIQAKITELQTTYDNNKYQRDRAAEYPSIPDQLDKIYHEGIDEWKKVIKAVKDANPKETE
jgi:hypothetical protein